MRLSSINTIYILIVMLLVLASLRSAIHGFNLEITLAVSLANIPSLYWIVIPYILKKDMEMPTWGHALKNNEHAISRLALFIICIAIYIVSVVKSF